MTVLKTDLAAESALHRYVRRGDFLDCYTVEIGCADAPIQDVAQRIFIGFPRWIEGLLALRDLGVTAFGLKTSAGLQTDKTVREQLSPGEAVNFLRVRDLSETEIILGEDDSHLDFRIAVRRDGEQHGRISLATWVHTHNLLGAVYLRTILPFHVMIVRSRLTAMATSFAPGVGGRAEERSL